MRYYISLFKIAKPNGKFPGVGFEEEALVTVCMQRPSNWFKASLHASPHYS
jgi:hypothetical protein